MWYMETGSTAEQEVRYWEQAMDERENLKMEIKKLNAQATALKMDLHDLAEDLPTHWERIREVADRAYEAYAALHDARRRMAAFGNS